MHILAIHSQYIQWTLCEALLNMPILQEFKIKNVTTNIDKNSATTTANHIPFKPNKVGNNSTIITQINFIFFNLFKNHCRNLIYYVVFYSSNFNHLSYLKL